MFCTFENVKIFFVSLQTMKMDQESALQIAQESTHKANSALEYLHNTYNYILVLTKCIEM